MTWPHDLLLAEIKPYEDRYRDQMISLWERSVRATHDFLEPGDIDYYKQLVNEIDFYAFDVYCLVAGEKVLGFMGISGDKIEALFLDPDHIGKGLGKKLMYFALDELMANKVDVNEQNTHAVEFYSQFGFRSYARTEKDDAGKDYPILKMRIPPR